jgi:hypothetical protein
MASALTEEGLLQLLQEVDRKVRCNFSHVSDSETDGARRYQKRAAHDVTLKISLLNLEQY